MAQMSFGRRLMDLLWGPADDDVVATSDDTMVAAGLLIGGLVVAWLAYLLVPLLRELLYYSPITFRAAAVSALTSLSTTGLVLLVFRARQAAPVSPAAYESLDDDLFQPAASLDPLEADLEASARAVRTAELRHAENEWQAWQVGLEARAMWSATDEDWQDLEAWVERGHNLLSAWRRKPAIAGTIGGRRLIDAMEDKLEAAAEHHRPARLDADTDAVETDAEVRARRD